MITKEHLLYSYRRCPYAMRARMALMCANIKCEVHEVDFKDKPEYLLEISPKATVPVLQTIEGDVIDESLDIMFWALEQNDPQGLIENNLSAAKNLVAENDGAFKAALDRYKYPNRFEDEDCSNARNNALSFLTELEEHLAQHKNLLDDKVTIADIAIFPFVRQFANVDKVWFEGLELTHLHAWLNTHLDSELFKGIIQKQDDNPYLLLQKY